MKKLVAYGVVLSGAILFCQLLLPWWILVLPSFTITYSFNWRPVKAFLLAFAICFIVSTLHVYVIDAFNSSLLSTRVGQLFSGLSPIGLIFLSAIVPALVSAMGALTASLTPRLFSTTN